MIIRGIITSVSTGITRLISANVFALLEQSELSRVSRQLELQPLAGT